MKLTITTPAGDLEYQLQKRETTIGRADTCDWVIPSERLSRTHCVVYLIKDKEKKQDRISILDPGSKNGIMVDGTRIEPNTMVPVTSTSLILMANQFILNIGEKKKVEMIDTSAMKVSAPVRKRTKYDKVEVKESAGKRFMSGLLSSFKKLAYFCVVIGTLVGGSIFFLYYL